MGFEVIVLLPKALSVKVLYKLRNRTYNSEQSFKDKATSFSMGELCNEKISLEDLLKSINNIQFMPFDEYFNSVNNGVDFRNYWIFSITLNTMSL